MFADKPIVIVFNIELFYFTFLKFVKYMIGYSAHFTYINYHLPLFLIASI